MKRKRKAGKRFKLARKQNKKQMVEIRDADTGDIRMVPIKSIRPGPIQHKSLHPYDLALARYTFDKLGYIGCKTFEQWELGFLRDLHPRAELANWLRASLAYCRYLVEHPDESQRAVYEDMIFILVGNQPKTLRQRELLRLASEDIPEGTLNWILETYMESL